MHGLTCALVHEVDDFDVREGQLLSVHPSNAGFLFRQLGSDRLALAV